MKTGFVSILVLGILAALFATLLFQFEQVVLEKEHNQMLRQKIQQEVSVHNQLLLQP